MLEELNSLKTKERELVSDTISQTRHKTDTDQCAGHTSCCYFTGNSSGHLPGFITIMATGGRCHGEQVLNKISAAKKRQAFVSYINADTFK